MHIKTQTRLQQECIRMQFLDIKKRASLKPNVLLEFCWTKIINWIINCKATDQKSIQAKWDIGISGFSTWAKAGSSIDLHLLPRVSKTGIETRYRAIQVRSGYRPIHILGVVWYFIPYSPGGTLPFFLLTCNQIKGYYNCLGPKI